MSIVGPSAADLSPKAPPEGNVTSVGTPKTMEQSSYYASSDMFSPNHPVFTLATHECESMENVALPHFIRPSTILLEFYPRIAFIDWLSRMCAMRPGQVRPIVPVIVRKSILTTPARNHRHHSTCVPLSRLSIPHYSPRSPRYANSPISVANFAWKH